MLYRVHTSENGSLHAFCPMRMGGNLESIVSGGRDYGRYFLHGELRVLAALGLTQHATGGRNLDEIRAFLIAAAHCFVGISHPVHHAFGGARIAAQFFANAIGRISVSSGGGEALAGGEHSRARNQALLYRAAQYQRNPMGGAKVANSGESRHEGTLGIDNGLVGIVSGFEHKALHETRWAKLRHYVHVRVYPSWHHGGVGQVYGVGMLKVAGLNRRDAVSANQDALFAEHLAGIHIDQPSGVDDCLFGHLAGGRR